MLINRYLWVFYLGVAPVYWIPFLSIQAWSNIKIVILLSAIFLTWVNGIEKEKLSFPPGICGIGGLVVLIFCSLPAFVQSEYDWGIQRTYDFLFGFCALWSFYRFWLIAPRPERVLLEASFIIAFFSMITISSKFLSVPDWHGPVEYESLPLTVSGFGALRTGWSNSLSFYVTPAFILMLTRRKKVAIWKIGFCFIVVGMIVGGQIVVAGRAGMVSSLFSIFWILWSLGKKKIFFSLVLMGIISSVFLISNSDIASHLRLDRILDPSSNNVSTLDHFSAGRISNYLFAIEKWLESPVFGHGYGNVEVIKGAEIHNLWLRLLAEGGIFLFGAFLYFCYRVTREAFFNNKIKKQPNTKSRFHHAIRNLFLVVFLQGFILSMFEPRILMGSFQVSALWWIVIGACCGQNVKHKREIHLRHKL
jgi:hypothetical protein